MRSASEHHATVSCGLTELLPADQHGCGEAGTALSGFGKRTANPNWRDHPALGG